MPSVVVQGTDDPGDREQPDADVIASCVARLRLLDEYDDDQCTALHLALLNGAVAHHTASLGACTTLGLFRTARSNQLTYDLSTERSHARTPDRSTGRVSCQRFASDSHLLLQATWSALKFCLSMEPP